MSEVLTIPPRWHSLLGHGVTVVALSLGGLSSFYALKTEVGELRATVNALVQTEADHAHRGDAALRESGQRRDQDLQQIREEIKELRADLREMRNELRDMSKKGAGKP